MRTCLTFQDVSIVPNYSTLASRSEVDLSSDCGWATLKTPLISSPMDTVTGVEMIAAMRSAGGDGVHHRYCPIDVLERVAADLKFPIAVSPSVGIKAIEYILQFNPKPVLVIDVAHGDSKPALDYAKACVDLGATVVSGNIVTPEAAGRYYNIGVNIFRVGVGCGSACSTRVVAGVGVSQLTAIMDIRNSFSVYSGISIISDGGVTHSGDIVKALVAGADCVMSGRLFAGCEEAPGLRDVINGRKVKQYRGMASKEAMDDTGKEHNIEGISSFIECNGTVASVMAELENGIRAGFAYVGAHNIKELRERAEFVQVTHNGHAEGMTRI